MDASAPIPHGTLTGYVRDKCRCEECKTASREAQQARRDRKRAEAGLPVYGGQGKQWQHGTTNGYGAHGCRCELCTAANSAMTARYRQRRLAEVKAGEVPAEAISHGRTGYTQGCRCEVCRSANAAYRRQRRAQGLEPTRKRPAHPPTTGE